jgi:putative transcriptional regulator
MTVAARWDPTPVWWRRHECCLSQQQLAAAVCASRQTIRSLERGRSTPSVTLALAIARALDSTVEELFAAGARPVALDYSSSRPSAIA